MHHATRDALEEQHRKPLTNQLPRFRQVRTFLEDQHDGRQSENRLRANRFQIGRTIEGIFQRYCHEAFDLFGRETWSLGLDFDQGWSKLRKYVERRIPQVSITSPEILFTNLK